MKGCGWEVWTQACCDKPRTCVVRVYSVPETAVMSIFMV